MSAYAQVDFSHLLGTPGFSDELLNDHFTLSQGYETFAKAVSRKRVSERFAEANKEAAVAVR